MTDSRMIQLMKILIAQMKSFKCQTREALVISTNDHPMEKRQEKKIDDQMKIIQNIKCKH